MSQTRLHSLGEALSNIAISFAIAFATNMVALPYLKARTDSVEAMAFWLTLIFSVISLVRTYFLRRLFNKLTHKGRFHYVGMDNYDLGAKPKKSEVEAAPRSPRSAFLDY